MPSAAHPCAYFCTFLDHLEPVVEEISPSWGNVPISELPWAMLGLTESSPSLC